MKDEIVFYKYFIVKESIENKIGIALTNKYNCKYKCHPTFQLTEDNIIQYECTDKLLTNTINNILFKLTGHKLAKNNIISEKDFLTLFNSVSNKKLTLLDIFSTKKYIGAKIPGKMTCNKLTNNLYCILNHINPFITIAISTSNYKIYNIYIRAKKLETIEIIDTFLKDRFNLNKNNIYTKVNYILHYKINKITLQNIAALIKIS